MNNKLRIFWGMSSVLLLPFSAGTVQAAYHADSDTGVNALDYIEDGIEASVKISQRRSKSSC